MYKTMLLLVGLVLVLAVGHAWAFEVGNEGPVLVGNWVFYDNNADGVMNEGTGDTGIGGVVLKLQVLNTDTGVFEAVTRGGVALTETTGSTDPGIGYYNFTNLPADMTYRVVVDTTTLPAGYQESYERPDDEDTVANQSTRWVTTTPIPEFSGFYGDINFDFGYMPETHDDGGGELLTVTQGGWGAKPHGHNPAMFLKNAFDAGVISTITIGGYGGYSLTFTSQKAIEVFLPQGGTPRALTSSTNYAPKNVLAGQVLAMSLNLYFYDAPGDLKFTSGLIGGCATPDDLLILANKVLSGDTNALAASGLTLSQLNDACTKYNENFDGGANKGFLIVP